MSSSANSPPNNPPGLIDMGGRNLGWSFSGMFPLLDCLRLGCNLYGEVEYLSLQVRP